MNSIVKKTTAYFLIFMLIFGMSMSSFAVTSPYLTLGNDNGAATVFSYYKDGDVFLNLTGKLYAKFENGVLKETNSPQLAPKITVVQNGSQADWTSLIPIAYVYVKNGEIKSLSTTPYLQTNKLAGNAGGFLYEYPASTKSGHVTTPDGNSSISHITFFFDTPVPMGKIIVTKDVIGDTPKTPGEFKFYLIKKGTPDTQYADFTITGENSFTINDVPFGNYALVEYSWPTGYAPQSTSEIPIVVSSETEPHRVTFTNTFTEQKFTIGVEKTLSGEGYPTDKVFTFELVNKTTSQVVKTVQITGAGTADFEPVPAGTYIIREVSIPTGFGLTPPNNVEVTVDTGIQPARTVFNNHYDPLKFNINVEKKVTGVPFFNNITFYFDLYLDVDDGDDILKDTVSIVGAGSATFAPVLEGNYYVSERDPDNSIYHLVDLSQDYNKEHIYIGPNADSNTVTFTNHHITYLLKVVKTVTGDERLEEHEFIFNLYRQSDPNIVIDTVKFFGAGEETFKPLEAGTYIVREVPVPGYELIPAGDRVVTFPAPEPEATAFASLDATESIIITPVADATVYFENKYTRLYDISVIKDIEGLPEGAPSSVFTFALFNTFAPTVEVDRITIIGEDVGHFKPVPAGNYIIKEINLPAGYEQVPFETEIQDETTLDGSASVGPVQPAVRVLFKNIFTQMFDIKVNKTLSGGSQNAVFTFRLFKVGNPEYLQELKIAGTGTDYFEPVPAGEYYVKEVNVPSGYDLRTTNDQPAVVHAQKPEAEVSFRNEYVEESTEPTTAPPSTEPTTAPPTTEPTTAPPSTENLTDESIAEGFNFDLIYDEPEELTEEETPLAAALPQTGQLPAGLFYGLGGLISSLGVYLKKRK